ncbi:hypothetical protein ACF0H5_009058 [Mactra antiquata]
MVNLSWLLIYCVLISCVTARGVPAPKADDHENTLEGREKEISSDEYSDLTNCKGCSKSKSAQENPLLRQENKGHNTGQSISNNKPPSFIKPSLSFKGIRIRVNEHRRHESRTSFFRNYGNHRTIYGPSSKEQTVPDEKQTLATYSNAYTNSSATEKEPRSNTKTKDAFIVDSTRVNDDTKKSISSKSSISLQNVKRLLKQPDKSNKVGVDEHSELSGLEKVIQSSLKSEVDIKKKELPDEVNERVKNGDENGAIKDRKETQPKAKPDHVPVKKTKDDGDNEDDLYLDDDIAFGKGTISSNQGWPGHDLRQLPEAAKLEWKLHPSVDIPVRDILYSLKNMIGYLQKGIQYVHTDYDLISNTTRWKYMMGVREGLTTLAEENDIIYSVVLETSLLTKEIYRKAHERRHPKPEHHVDPIVADYRQRYMYNIGMEIHNEETRAHREIEKAKVLVDKMKQRIEQRESLKAEVRRMSHLVRNGFSLSALHDLERRANQIMNTMAGSPEFPSFTDRANLYAYIGEDIQSTIKETNDLLSDSYDVITRAKQIVMTNQEKVHQYEMLLQSAFRPVGMIDKLERVVAKDRATLHAQGLSDTAAFTMITLKPLIQEASKLISHGPKYSFEKRLTQTASNLQELVKKLRIVYDKIIIEIDDDRVYEERCETIEGSGWFDDDDDEDTDGNGAVMINCEPYIKVIESSGDALDLEGSGDIDDGIEIILPDNDDDININKTDDDNDDNTVDIDIEEITMATNTDDIIYIDESDENLEVIPTKAMEEESEKEQTTSIPSPKTMSPETTTTPSTKSSSEVLSKAMASIESGTIESHSFITIPTTSSTPSAEKATTHKPLTTESTTSSTTTKAKTTTPSTTATTKTTSKTTTTTPSTRATTTKAKGWWPFGGGGGGDDDDDEVEKETATTETTKETKEEAGEVSNWFGEWSNDEPVNDNVNFGFENDLMIHGHLLNNLIRQRLSNYTKESNAVMSQAKVVDDLSKELSLTWLKVERRFKKFENSSLRASTFLTKWKAEKHLYHAIHDRLVEVKDEVITKNDLVNSQCETAIDKVEKKVKSMEKQLESKNERDKTAAVPGEYNIAKEKVSMVTKDVEEIQRLKQLYPNPCSVLERVDNAIKTNITELRNKIAKAKLLTSSLKLSIGVQKDSEPMVYNIPQDQRLDNPLRDNIRVMLKHTGSEGHVMSIRSEDEEMISLEVRDNGLQIVQTLDGDDEVLTVINSSNITPQQYLLNIERFGTVYNFTFSTMDDTQIDVNTGSLFDAPNAFLDNNVPTSLHIGGSESLSMCFNSLQVNGHHVDWFNQQNNNNVLPTVCESQSRWLTFDSHLLLDGSGFAIYKLPERMKSYSLSFNPRSPGTIFVIHDSRKSMLIDGYIGNDGHLTLYLKYYSFTTQMVANVIYGMDYTIKLIFKSGSIRRVDVTINDQSDLLNVVDIDRRSLMEEKTMENNIYIGGLPYNKSTFIGCIKTMFIDNEKVLFETFKEAENIKFGECHLKNCVEYSKDSSPIEMNNVFDITTLYLVVKKGSLGPVLQFSKSRQKFSLTVSLSTEGVDIEETINEETKTIYTETEDEYITIKILEDVDDQSLKVTVNDKTEEIDYAEYSWGIKQADSYTNYTYDVIIGGSTDDDKPFIGSITEFILNGSPFTMTPYITENKLAGCQSHHTVEEYKRPKVYPTITCS